jgi:Zn-dependent M28 family amino/carboxypeptidase
MGHLPHHSLPEASGLAERLRRHVETLAARERNTDLETPARYIESELGAGARRQPYPSGGRTVCNVEIGEGPIVVGAHYDTVPGSPGADDNASGVAAVIELSKIVPPGKVRFVAFANEELPYSHGDEMGSSVYAKRSRDRGERISAMFSLEMLGCYSDAPGSQRYPPVVGWFYPDRADFIAFVADLGAWRLVRRSSALFRRHSDFPSQWLAAPAFVPGITRSDHWSFRRHGFPAVMVTDTAFNRYPHYHLPSDTPEKLDYERMAKVTLGLAAMLGELSTEQ